MNGEEMNSDDDGSSERDEMDDSSLGSDSSLGDTIMTLMTKFWKISYAILVMATATTTLNLTRLLV